ncbi:ferredoxin [Rhodococcus pseudokoreensis]|uniref:Ferredoxin n=1 Tax=Rhodococcus pseudokoreensis TaxID=2811421 RepID=A0A974W3N3_9NOCA|nr:ferredoxin [Rhodococcus pseudokoreensis]QSE90653.1 ferredoxin [Rhodococcus pseudokoreensis]
MLATIRVDRDVCCGNGMCFALAPEVFDLDDDAGVVKLLDPTLTPENRAAVEQAVACCPTAAIEIEIDQEETA